MKKAYKWLLTIFLPIKKAILLKINSDVLYNIVSFSDKSYEVSFQCNLTRAIFSKSIQDAITDPSIICHINSEQACFLGLKAGIGLRAKEISITYTNLDNNYNVDKNPLIFDRVGNMIFMHPKTNKKCMMKPEFVISERELINLFPPCVACSIGIFVGYKKLIQPLQLKTTKHNLRLVKSA